MKIFFKQRLVWSSSLLIGLVAAVVIGAVSSDTVVQNFDQVSYQAYMAGKITDLNDLQDDFQIQQYLCWPLIPPMATFQFSQEAGLQVYDPKGFPASFTKGLVAQTSAGIKTYPITVMEDAKTRNRLVLNAKGAVIATIAPPAGYNPTWLALEIDSSFAHNYATAILTIYDPSRISVNYTFIDQTNLVKYLLNQAVAVSQQQQTMSMMAMAPQKITPKMMYVPTVSNLTIAGFTEVTNTVKLTIGYPSGWTNRLELFVTTDLLSYWWMSLGTSNVDLSTNAIEWVDTTYTNIPLRFYRAGDGQKDSDGDGLTDAQEKLMYHSSPTNTDTDSDGLSDYYEIMTLNTDPSNPDTTAPTAYIIYPTNNFTWISTP